MARTRTMIVNTIMALVAAFVAASCGDAGHFEEAAATVAVPVAYEPLDSGSVVVYYDDGTTVYPVKHHWELEAEAPIHAKGAEPFAAAEPLSKKAQDELMFMYNYGKVNTLKVTGIAMTYKGKTIYPKDMSEMLVKGEHEVAETAVKPFFETSFTDYVLVYGNIVLASARQMFRVDEGYTPAWVCNQWHARHNSFIREATRSNNSVTVKCNNTATFWQLFDDNSHRDSADVKYTVLNKFNMTIPEMEVEDKSSLYNKSFAFVAETATVQGNNVKAQWQSAAIEKNVPYKGVDYKDSIAPCVAYAKNLVFNADATAITVYFFDKDHENSEDYATVTMPVKVSETVKFKEYELVGNPIHDSWNAVYEISDGFAITCNNHVVVREVMTDGSKGNSFDLPYKSTNVWSVSGTSFQVESLSSVLNVREDIVNGSANIAGNLINLTHSMSAEKVSKGTFSYQPAPCEAVAKYITVISATQALVDIYHDNTKIGDYLLPVNITEKPADVDVEIMRISITDAYINQHKAQEGTYLHIFGKDKNGSYVVLSQRIGESAFKSSTLSNAEGDAILKSGRAIAYVFNNFSNKYQIGTVTSEDGVADKGYYLCYYVAGGGLAYSLGNGTGTEALKDGFRDAIRGTVSKANADGTWSLTADGKTYTFVGL